MKSDLVGERLLLRPAQRDHTQALVRILAEPEVSRWWGRYDLERVHKDLPDTFVIVIDNSVAGWLLFHEETDPDYRHVGLDIMLTTRLHGQGYGREALRLVIDHFVEHGHHRFTIDPAVENRRAIRAYTAVGFKPVGVMRAYGRSQDGRWHDHILMDLLAWELVDPAGSLYGRFRSSGMANRPSKDRTDDQE